MIVISKFKRPSHTAFVYIKSLDGEPEKEMILSGAMCHFTKTSSPYYTQYSQTCLKGSPREGQKVAAQRQVTPYTGSYALYFGSRDQTKAVLKAGDPLIEVTT